MPPDSFELRIPLRKLLIGLLLTVVPICLAGLYTLSVSEKSLERSIGTHFKTIAEGEAAEVAQFVHDRVLNVGALAADPAVRDAVQSANRSYQGLSEEAVRNRIERIEAEWNTPAAEARVGEMLSSRPARMLRDFGRLDSRFLRITVTDERGATIAGTHKTLDYFQADEPFWQAVYANGRGAVDVTDILYDQVTMSNYIGVGVPVTEEDSGRFIGVVHALVDVSTLFPLINRVSLGPTARIQLIKDDGTVITAPNAMPGLNLKSEEFAVLQDATQSLHRRQTGYVVASVLGGGELIGFADTGLKEDYRNLGWMVVVAQDVQEAFAATRTVRIMLALMILIGLAAVTLLAAYFSLHRRRTVMDIHPEEDVSRAA
jgi:hypothetical protein